MFLEDIKKLDTPEFLDAIKAANAQGAFVFWNHQAWQGEDKGVWLDVHTTMFETSCSRAWRSAMASPITRRAHKWCLEKNLTMLGNSDIHEFRTCGSRARRMTTVR